MCYRRDLFEKAGLPTDRDEVSALWPTWEDFIATGEKFQDGIGDDDVHFVDSATNTYNSILMQSGRRHLLRHRRQPGHRQPTRRSRTAWDTVARRWSTPASAPSCKSFSNEWNAGFKNGTFATVACPAWMTGYIEEQAGDGERRQVGHRHRCPAAAATGAARSSPCRPTSEHQDLAIELAQFLTSADGQLGGLRGGGQPAVQPDALRRPGR